MPSYNATALVLHRTDLGEYDRILTLFTREKGKLQAVAKGARRASSRTSGATELFIRAHLHLAIGRSLDIVTQCEIEAAFTGLRHDLGLLARATYLCELLDRLTGERDESSCLELFDLTVGALFLLQRAAHYPDSVVHAYEMQILGVLGYAPSLSACVVCGRNLPERGAGFSPELGGLVCASDRYRSSDTTPFSPEAVQAIQELQAADPEGILRLHPTPQVAAEIARALRWFVRLRAERTLKSAEFLDQLRESP